MKITKTEISRINKINFDKLDFGKTFSDHMLVCDYKNGSWREPQIIPYQKLSFAPSTHVFHYGQAIFEGLKAFKNKKGEVLIFRPRENFLRLNKSAERLCMPTLPENIFMQGIIELLKIDNKWIPVGKNKSLYIRPFFISTSEFIRATPSNDYMFAIITSPCSNYYSGEVNLKIEERYSRAVPGGVGFAKAAGNYAASFHPTKKAQENGFTQIIWTDSTEHKYIEESGTMNIMFRINNELITPKLTDTILSGITRKSILEIAKSNGIKVLEKKITVKEIINAAENNNLKEVFGLGTAVTINEINSINYKGKKIILEPILGKDSYSKNLKKELQDIQYGLKEDTYNWVMKI